MVGARALELGGHLRHDHVHRFRFAQTPFAHQALQSHRAGGINEDDAVEVVRHAPLEQQGDVADHEMVAALAGLLHEHAAHALHLWMHDGVELLEFSLFGEHDPAQRTAIQAPVCPEDGRAPTLHDGTMTRRSRLHGAPGEHVGIDDRRPALAQ